MEVKKGNRFDKKETDCNGPLIEREKGGPMWPDPDGPLRGKIGIKNKREA